MARSTFPQRSERHVPVSGILNPFGQQWRLPLRMQQDDLPFPEHQLLAQQRWVRSLARTLVRDWHEAADLEQQAYLAALESDSQIRSLRAWLATVIRRRAVSAIRADTRRRSREEKATPPRPSESPDEIITNAETHQRLLSIVMALKEPYRATILFRYFGDLSPLQIAEHVGVPVQTVRTRLKRAHHILRQRLDSELGGRGSGGMRALALLAAPTIAGPSTAGLKGVLAMTMKSKLSVAAAAGILAVSAVVVAVRSTPPPASVQRQIVENGDSTEALPGLQGRSTMPPDALVGAQPTARTATGGRGLYGTVTDSSGNAIPGATLIVHYKSRRPRITRVATTNDVGSYQIGGIPMAGGELWVHKEGYYVPGHDDSPPPADTVQVDRGIAFELVGSPAALRRDIVLNRGVPLGGRVVDTQGRPVGGTSVLAKSQRRFPPLGSHAHLRVNSVATTADEQGRFTFAGLAPRADWVLSAKSKTMTSVVDTPAPLDTDMPPKDVEIVVLESASIGGRVLGPAGDPAPGVFVRLSPSDALAPTDKSGLFRFHDLRPGAYSVYLVVQSSNRPIGEAVAVTLSEGTHTRDIELHLSPESEIRGVLVDQTGEPLPGILLQARSTAAEDHRDRAMARTDESGAFHFRTLAGATYDLLLGSIRLAHRVAGGTQDVRLVHRKSDERVLRGQVQDAEGKIVGQVSLRVSAESKSGGAGRTYPSVPGSFELDWAFGEGRVSVTAWDARASTGTPLNLRPATVHLTDPSQPIVIRMRPGRHLHGSIQDAEGLPVAGVQVAVREHRSADGRDRWPHYYGKLEATSAPDGRFSFLGLHDGEVVLDVNAPTGFASKRGIEVGAGVGEVVVSLDRGGTLSGKVTDSDGRPLIGVPVRIAGGSPGRPPPVRTRAGGVFKLESLAGDGPFIVQAGPATIEGDAYLQSQLQGVTPGREDLVLELTPGLMIRGTVVGPSGEAVKDGSVQALDAMLQKQVPNGRVWLDRLSNEFAIGPLEPGSYVLIAHPSAGPFTVSEPMQVSAPASAVQIVLRKGYVLRGQLRGTDVEGFRVRWWSGVRGVRRFVDVRTDATGHFSIPALGPGHGSLLIQRDEDDRVAFDEDVDPSVGPLRVSLVTGLTIQGKLVAKQGEPAEAFQVQAKRGGRVWAKTMSDPDGTFVIRGLPAGEYSIYTFMPVTPVVRAAAGDRDLRLVQKK